MRCPYCGGKEIFNISKDLVECRNINCLKTFKK